MPTTLTLTPDQIKSQIRQHFWLGHMKLTNEAIIVLQEQGIELLTHMGDIREDG